MENNATAGDPNVTQIAIDHILQATDTPVDEPMVYDAAAVANAVQLIREAGKLTYVPKPAVSAESTPLGVKVRLEWENERAGRDVYALASAEPFLSQLSWNEPGIGTTGPLTPAALAERLNWLFED